MCLPPELPPRRQATTRRLVLVLIVLRDLALAHLALARLALGRRVLGVRRSTLILTGIAALAVTRAVISQALLAEPAAQAILPVHLLRCGGTLPQRCTYKALLLALLPAESATRDLRCGSRLLALPTLGARLLQRLCVLLLAKPAARNG
eukprot:scaffold113658_cov47-Phaeocystis_antarctica.AAC.2